jgi:shikimate kinase
MSNELKDERDFPAPVRRIVLTGFMGSGKSTVGPLLAARLGWRFVDADDVVVAETGMPVSEFFARFGEAAFRERERETVARLAAEDGLVLALGGGAIESDATRQKLLNGDGTLLVHLEVALETTLSRCGGTEGTRPVLADRANLEARYARRLPFYRTAHISVAADEVTPDEVAEAILKAASGPGRAAGAGA